ncbi:MAG: hypothetical protein K2L99_05105 [Muribaculaceae bacterium]|nr:hypothetical protein [Muribaculaceae bacterium]
MTAANDTLRLRHEMCMRVVDYQDALSQLLTVVEDDDGRVHRYYTRDAGITLSLIADDIRRLASQLGDDGVDAWLEDEKRKMLGEQPIAPRECATPVATSGKPKKLLWGLGAAAALLAGWQGMSYAVSGEERARFDETMATAEAAMGRGEYESALGRADSAAGAYSAAFMSGLYKDKARTVARAASGGIIEAWRADVRRYLNAGRPELAKARTLSLPANLNLDDASAKTFAETCREIDEQLARRCDAFVEALIADAYNHGGRISEKARMELESIVEVVPDNYWLNHFKRMADEK